MLEEHFIRGALTLEATAKRMAKQKASNSRRVNPKE
jgi:hypothetical protein